MNTNEVSAIWPSKSVFLQAPSLRYCLHSLKLICKALHKLFRVLKTDLSLRPVYHQSDENFDAHIILGVLSHAIVNTVRYQLKAHNIRHDW